MATTQLWQANFRIINLSNAAPGNKATYFLPDRQAVVVAASQAAARTALAADITLGSGESLEVIDMHQVVIGENTYS